ncbi:hypothetical protein JW835_14695 [bacterium]|nr:hypothetical protein [bacterium]
MKTKVDIRIENAIKRTIWTLFVRHAQSSKKNIFLFSTRRGGSTWLRDIITINRGIRFIDHAFGYLGADRIVRKYLKKQYLNQYINNDDWIKDYLALLASGRLIGKTDWRFWHPQFDFVSNRILFKITEAKALCDWFYENNNAHFIYQIRHPIANAHSLYRLNWGLTADAYLKNERYCDKYITSDQYDYAMDILKGRKSLNQYVLNWVLENLPPLKSKYLKNWLRVSYEEMVLRPECFIILFVKELKLDEKEKMFEMVNKPSKSSRLSTTETKNAINKADSNYVINKWRKDVDKNIEREAMAVLEKFDLDIYRYNSDFCDKSFMNFMHN